MNQSKGTIAFIGTGFIGTAMASDFENRGYETVRYSLEKKYIKNKNKIKSCFITFIAVPTPSTPEGFDYSIVEDVLSLIGSGNIAVIKSTVLPGTTEKLQKKFPLITVLHSPEFLTEKTAKKDAEYPTRNIVGYVFDSNYEAAELVMGVLPVAPYKAIVKAEDAEMIKYANNCWFYFKVIYMNLLYDLCQKSEVSFEIVKNAMSFDPRIGFTHLEVEHQGGRGAGGHCLLPDTKIITDNGIKNISDIKKGENVLTHTGVFRKVLKTSERLINEPVNYIKGQGLQPFYITNEHPIFSVATGRKYLGIKRKKLSNIKTNVNLTSKWILPNKLSIGDYLSIPQYKEKSKKIKVDKDFLRLAGYYIADGWHVKGRIEFGFNIFKTDVHEDVKNIVKKLYNYDVKMYPEKDKNVMRVRIHSIEIAKNFLELFGKLAQNKHYPDEWLYQDDDCLKEMIKGYCRCDGSFSKNVFTSATISEKLDSQLRFIFYRLGINCNSTQFKERVDKIGQHHKKSYYITIPNIIDTQKIADIVGIKIDKTVKLNRNTSPTNKNINFRPVREIDNLFYNGLVYNLEVEKDNSYVGLDGCFHNCFIKDMAAFANLYRSRVPKDKIGKKLLSAMEEKNIELLLETGKNLDLLTGVYGNGIIK